MTGVVVDHDGATETYTADIVVVSCGAANSAKLLLASASDAHPNGLANGSDLVGRNYMFHNSAAVLALSQGAQPDGLPEDARPQRLLLPRRDSTTRSATSRWSASRSPRDVPRREAAADEARARVDAARRRPHTRSTSGSRPRTCRAPTTGSRCASDGQIALAYRPTNERAASAAAATSSSAARPPRHAPRPPASAPRVPEERHPGRWSAPTRPAPAASARDPATSVLNTDCRAHEVDNLYVVDTSFFPSIGAVNPALTAMANSLRVGDHLLERLGARRGRPEVAHA